MKTLKFIGMALMSIALSTGFTSCSSDDDPEPVTPKTSKLWRAYNTGTEKWGFINENGDFAIAAQYDNVNNFSCGRAKVKTGGMYYYIDQSGKIINSTGFEHGEDFYNNYAVVEKDDVEGLINTNGDYVIQPMYLELGDVASNGLLSFCITRGKYGYIDLQNQRKIDHDYAYVSVFINGVACVLQGSKWGAINAEKRFVIQPTYNSLKSITGKSMIIFSEKTSGSSSSLYGIMDQNGNIKVQAIYQNIDDDETGNGILRAQNTSGKYGFIDVDGNTVIPFNYDDAMSFRGELTAVRTKKSDSGYGYNNYNIIDRTGRILFTLGENEEPVLYEPFYDNMVLTQKHEDGATTFTYRNASNKIVYTWTK